MNAQFGNSENKSKVAITLQNPTPGSVVDIASSTGGAIKVSFDLTGSSLARDGDNLLLITENGGEVRLLGYFNAGERSLADFVLSDGITVAGADFLKAMDPDMDISVGAGPAEEESSIDGSGIGEYLSDANALIGGVDRLDGLGTRYWDRGTKVSEYSAAQGLESDTSFDEPFNPPSIPPVEPPIEPPFKPPVGPPLEPRVGPPGPVIEPPVPPVEPPTPPVEPPTPPVEPPVPPVEPPMPPVEPPTPPVEPPTPPVEPPVPPVEPPVPPVEPPMPPVEPPTPPVEPPVPPVEPPTPPVEPPTPPVEPPTPPVEPPTPPVEPPVPPVEPPTPPVEPPVPPVEPPTPPVEPPVPPVEPPTPPVEPPTPPVEPPTPPVEPPTPPVEPPVPPVEPPTPPVEPPTPPVEPPTPPVEPPVPPVEPPVPPIEPPVPPVEPPMPPVEPPTPPVDPPVPPVEPPTPPVEPPTPPVEPPTPPVEPPVPPDGGGAKPYQARAVLYKTDPDQNNTDNNTVQFRILSDGEPVKPSDNVSDLNFSDRNNYFKNFSFDPATGIATFELSDEGLAALLAAGSANIYDYITFNYMVNGQPKTYTMQLVVNQDNNYNSAAEDALNAPDGGSPVWGEWHTESKGAADGNRVTSQGNDETWFSSRGTGDDAFHGDLSTQAGNDTLWFNGRVYESNIDMGSGNNIATITSESHDNDWYGMQNSHITAGTDQNSLYIKNTNVAGNTSSGIDAGSGSSVDFSRGHDGIINITVDRGDAGGTAQGIAAESDSGGTSLDIKGDADSRIFIDARSNADNARGVYVNGDNTITMEGGDIDVNATGGRVTYGMFAQSGGKLQVDAAGKLSVTANSANGDKDSFDGVLGVHAYERSAMDINAHEVEVKATSAHGNVHGVSAESRSHLNITSQDKVSITATVGNSDSSSSAVGVAAALRSDSTISGSHIDIKAVSDAGSAMGVSVLAGSEVTLQGYNGKNNTIDIYSRGDSSRGVQANGASSTAYIKGGDKDDVINITSESAGGGDAIGVETALRGKALITGGAGNDTLNIKALNTDSGNAVGMRGSYGTGTGNSVHETGPGPGTGGQQEILGVENVSIEAKANGGSATGMFSSYGAQTIKDSKGALDFSVKAETNGTGTADGMFAHVGKNSVIGNSVSGQDADSFTIQSRTANGAATGMRAFQGGENSITGGASGADKLNLSAVAGGSGDATGLLAYSDGKNTVSEVDLVSITAQSKSGGAVGMQADSGGVNSINHANDVNIAAKSGNNTGIGLLSSGGSNIINGNYVSVSAEGGNNVDAHGVRALDGGSNSISANTVSINAKGGVNATGLYAREDGAKNIISGDTVSLSAHGGTLGYAIYAQGGGENTIVGKDFTVNAYGGETWATGLYAKEDGSKNNVIADNVHITSETKGGSGYGTQALDGGSNSISANTVSINAYGGETWATGLYAKEDGSKNNVTADNVHITSETKGGRGYGTQALDGGSNSISANTVSINAKSGVNATGLYAREAGAKNIISGDTVSLSAHGGTLGYAIYAQGGGENTIVGKDFTVNAYGGETWATGLFAKEDGSKNNVTADNVNITSETKGGRGYGLFSAIDGASNTITGHNVTISGQGGLQGYGLLSEHNGVNTIVADNVSISARSSKDLAHGLSSNYDSINTISGRESGMTVTITATASAAQKAIAMWANHGGAVNHIAGHSKAGSRGDDITLTANNGRGVAMWAGDGGKNIISTGAGDDRVTINGAVQGRGNEINVGGGSNTVTLNGAVTAGSLNVHAGPGGSYNLILQASNPQDFIGKYGSWLKAIGSNDLVASGLQSINFVGLGASNLSAFLHEFNDLLWNMKEHVAIMPPSLANALHNPAVPSAHAGLNISEEMYESPVAANAQWEAAHQDRPESQSILSAMVAVTATVDSGAGGHDSVNSWQSVQADTSQAHHFPDVNPATVAGGDGAENTVIGVADAQNDVLDVLAAPEVNDLLPLDTVADADGHDVLPLDFTDMGGALPDGEWLHVEDQSGVPDEMPGVEILAEESVHDGQLYLADENSLGDVWPALITDVRDDGIETLLTTPAVETLVVNNDEVSDLELLLDKGTGVVAGPGVEQNPVSAAIVDAINDSAFTALATDETLMLYIQHLAG